MATDLTWLIGGPQGSGVESGANIFSKVCAGIGYQVFGKREFYSNIKGEHSYFAVRISDKKIHSNVNDINLMVAFDAEMIFRHIDEVVEVIASTFNLEVEQQNDNYLFLGELNPETMANNSKESIASSFSFNNSSSRSLSVSVIKIIKSLFSAIMTSQ